MGKLKLNISAIVIGRTRVVHPSSYKPGGTVPGYLVQCHWCEKHFGVCVGDFNRGRGLFCSQDCDRSYRLRTPEERFWDKVNKTDSCWLWTGCTLSFGHGYMHNKPLNVLAHRFSWEIHNGPIPEDLQVLHACDVPQCVNPDHLFLGTQADNIQDAINKGRHAIGERNGRHLLTEQQVIKILDMYDAGKTKVFIAEQFGVTRGAIDCITRNVNWKHIKRLDR